MALPVAPAARAASAPSLCRPALPLRASALSARRPFHSLRARSLTFAHTPSHPVASLRNAQRLHRRSHAASPSQHRFQSSHAASSATGSQPPLAYSGSSEPVLPPDAPLLDPLLQSNDRHIGFLYENYGIDFGWGTSSIMKMLFEAVHCTGSDFWLSILATGLIMRFGLSPFNRLASNLSAKMQAMAPVLKPLREKMAAAAVKNDRAAQQELRQEMKEVNRVAGIRPYHMFFNFLQIPLGFGCWRTFSNMAANHVDGLSTGGILWFKDLTVSDPYMILPLLTVGTQFATFWGNTESGSALSASQQKFQKIIMVALPVLFFPFIVYQPAAIQLHFLTTASFAILLNALFRSPAARRLLRMIPRTSTAPSTAPAAAGSKVPSAAKPAANASFRQRLRSWSDRQRDELSNSLNEGTSGKFSLNKKDQSQKAARRAADKHEEKRQKEISQARAQYERHGRK